MALNFRVKGDSNKSIEWSVVIDEDGDLALAANDTQILYIGSEDGKIHRYTGIEIEGLKLDERKRIEVAY